MTQRNLNNLIIESINHLIGNEPNLALPIFEKCLEIIKAEYGLNLPGNIYSDIIYSRKQLISNIFSKNLNNTVCSGPFHGLKLSDSSFWGQLDRLGMLLGLYEKEVIAKIIQNAGTNNIFIDLGAADGFFGIGVLINKFFKKSYCFEMDQRGREIILQNARINNVENNVIIQGKAEKYFYNSIPSEELKNCVLLCDIEGAEYEIFGQQTFDVLKSASIIIEIHDSPDGNNERAFSRLKNDGMKTHNVSIISTGDRNPNIFEFLGNLSDIDRWLICSEGRPKLMNWLYFEPLDELQS